MMNDKHLREAGLLPAERHHPRAPAVHPLSAAALACALQWRQTALLGSPHIRQLQPPCSGRHRSQQPPQQLALCACKALLMPGRPGALHALAAQLMACCWESQPHMPTSGISWTRLSTCVSLEWKHSRMDAASMFSACTPTWRPRCVPRSRLAVNACSGGDACCDPRDQVKRQRHC